MMITTSNRIKWVSILMVLALLIGGLSNIGVTYANETPTDTPAAGEETPTDEPTAPPTETPIAEPTQAPVETPTPQVSEGTPGGDSILRGVEPPKPASPSGVIYNNLPTYTWDQVSGATHYNLNMYQVTMRGDIKIIDMNFRAVDICRGIEPCKVRPATTLALGNYKWRVRVSFPDNIVGGYSDWQPFTYASTTPTARTPNGIAYEEPPIFKWNEMPGVTEFQIQVFTSKGVLSHSQTVTEPTCESSVCSVESEKEFVSGKYYWRIRAQIGTTWYAYSASRNFVLTPDITSDFTNYSLDWKPFGGGTWILSSGEFLTYGRTGKMTSARSAYEYNNFEFEARVKRDASPANSSFPANYIAVRMGSGKMSPRHDWYPGYLFGYTNAGNYSVWRMNANGTATAIQPWTDSNYVDPNDWNKLGVIADGSRLDFYINDNLVFFLENSKFSKGFVGFEAYKSDAGQSIFRVDYANVTRLFEGTRDSTGVISAEQKLLNLEAYNQPRSGTLAGYEPGKLTGGIPETSNPEGTIYTKNPRFTWEAVVGATQYLLHLERTSVHGVRRVFSRTYLTTSICQLDECSVISPVSLGNGTYEWKVRAIVDGGEEEFSEKKVFRIAPASPTLVSPKGTLYNVNRPEFSWTEIENASQYRIEIWRSIGAIITHKTLQNVDCSEGRCKIISPVTLPFGSYIWRVRAFLNGSWQPYSGWSLFTIGNLINSNFTSNSMGWSNLFGGTWALSSGRYLTAGSAGKFTSTRYAYIYRDFEFTALVKRNETSLSGSQPANFIAVRMGISSKGPGLAWYGGYLFGYTNAGEYSIWRMNSNGSATAIQPWTPSAAIIVNDWNELKVAADGDEFDFYINDTLVHSFKDSTYKQGYVGFQMYRPADVSSQFMVDNAYLELIDALSMAPASSAPIEPEQIVLNQKALSDPAADSIEGTP